MPRIVQSVGPYNAKIALVGEAPGSEEERGGVPFIGAAGQALNDFLTSAGILRSQVYITNVIKECPPDNDIEHFIKLGGKTVLTPEAESYIRQLRNELEALSPNIVVAFGNVPLWVLTGKFGITKWRGSILESTLVPGLKVIPTIHPAATLWNRDGKGLFQHYVKFDLKRVAEESFTPEINLPNRVLDFIENFEQVKAFLLSMRQHPILAFDIETSRDQVSCLSFAPDGMVSFCIPFTRKGHNIWSPEEELIIWRLVAEILQDPSIIKVGQNLHFDFSFLFNIYGIRIENLEDTMVAHWCLFPDLPKGLDFITSTLTREPYYKDEGKKHFKNPGDDETFWRYNARDSAICMEVWPTLKKDLERQGNWEAYCRQRDLIPALVYMQTKGMRIDTDGLNKARVETDKLITDLTKQFTSECGAIVNPNSTKDLKEHFYIRRGIKPYIDRKSGNPTVDGGALKRIAVRYALPEASTLLKIRHYSKLKGTYLDVTLDADGRLRGAFNPCGTKSGRLSSSETIFGTGTNLQNLPEEFKKFILADEETVLYNLDLSQAENKTVAYIAPDANMIKLFTEGIDPHRFTASFIFKKPWQDISDEDCSSDLGTGEHSERFWGKKANHSLNYDMGPNTFAFTFDLPQSAAKDIVDGFHRAYPGIKRMYAWVKDELTKTRTLIDCLGKRRLFMTRWGEDLFKEAYSYTPQSTVAGKMNRDGVLFTFLEPSFEEVILLNTVHDSLVLEIPTSLPAQEHARIIWLIKESLESPLTFKGRQFVINTAIECGHSYGEMQEIKAGTIEQLQEGIEECLIK